MAASGAIVLDASSVLADLDAGTYLAGLSTDNIHPNDAGHAAVAALARPYLR